jgi:aspartyl-tRNA(Asn)/glutamyl-tRNA(Gln) amidotransferase subunit A
MTGHPAVTFATEMHSLGLPIGVQLIGRYFEERVILKVAAVLAERAGPIPLPDLR